MSIVRKTLKNGKYSITSTCFDDIRTYRMSLSESKQDDYVSAKWRRNAGRDFSQIEFETVKQCMLLAKKGCNEISEYVKQLKNNEVANYQIAWGPCKDYISYDDLIEERDALEAKRAEGAEAFTADDFKRLDHVNAEIDSFDRHLEVSRAAVLEEIEKQKAANA